MLVYLVTILFVLGIAGQIPTSSHKEAESVVREPHFKVCGANIHLACWRMLSMGFLL